MSHSGSSTFLFDERAGNALTRSLKGNDGGVVMPNTIEVCVDCGSYSGSFSAERIKELRDQKLKVGNDTVKRRIFNS
jgi:hypothetical protein